MKKEKTRFHYGWVALLALLLGFGIQFLLGWSEARREAAASAAVLSGLGEEARAVSAAEIGAREARREACAERIALLPQIRRDARDAREAAPLTLVNRWTPLPEGYKPKLVLVAELDNREYKLDACCAKAYAAMMEDCARAGGKPYICSAYRSEKQQQELYRDKIRRLVEEGVPWGEAPELASQTVAVPGTSEHQLALSVDLIDEDYPYLDELQQETYTQQWLMKNCWRYGFILRYPNGTTEQTGIIYEPWHYRYVGLFCAEEIHRTGMTLEEYLLRSEGR